MTILASHIPLLVFGFLALAGLFNETLAVAADQPSAQIIVTGANH